MNMIERVARAMEREHTMRDMLHTGPDFPAISRAALMAIRDSDPTMSREVRRWIDAALNEKG